MGCLLAIVTFVVSPIQCQIGYKERGIIQQVVSQHIGQMSYFHATLLNIIRLLEFKCVERLNFSSNRLQISCAAVERTFSTNYQIWHFCGSCFTIVSRPPLKCLILVNQYSNNMKPICGSMALNIIGSQYTIIKEPFLKGEMRSLGHFKGLFS